MHSLRQYIWKLLWCQGLGLILILFDLLIAFKWISASPLDLVEKVICFSSLPAFMLLIQTLSNTWRKADRVIQIYEASIICSSEEQPKK